jgi:hypothetical protein
MTLGSEFYTATTSSGLATSYVIPCAIAYRKPAFGGWGGIDVSG